METNLSIAGNTSSVTNSSAGDVAAIFTAVVLGLIILTTVIGNVFVIAAIFLERNLQSVANYLIVSLAVADLMVACLVMPLGAVYEINSSGWPLGPALCDMWTSSDVLCCTASILHLVAIAVDRYWAVTDLNYIQVRQSSGALTPEGTFLVGIGLILRALEAVAVDLQRAMRFQAPQARNPRRIGMLVVAVWVVSLGVSLAPQLGWKDPGYLDRIADGKCLVSQDAAYQIFATCATFYVPLLVILFLYWRIFQAARRRIRKRPGAAVQPPRERRGILRLVTRRPREESTTAFTITRSTPDHSSASPEKTSSYNGANPPTTPAPNSQPSSGLKKTRETIEAKRERKAAKTLAIITGAFVACWLPFFLVALLQALCEPCAPSDIVASVFLWLGYFNSTLNPLIYTIFSPEFRQAFKRMLCGTRVGRG